MTIFIGDTPLATPAVKERPLKVLKLTVKRHAGECADDAFCVQGLEKQVRMEVVI